MENTNDKDSKKLKEAEEKLQRMMKAIADVLSRRDIYYVMQDNKYWEYSKDTYDWSFYAAEALRNAEPALASADAFAMFRVVMKESGRIYNTRTYSFNPQPASVLNQLRKDGWLKPNFERSEATDLFDCLIYSLGGGKEENITHIKQVIGYKYLHPEAYTLPALCFYGAGETGKSLFAETIMGQIFGKSHVQKGSFSALDKFNAWVAGKSVVFFDEQPQREDQSRIKGLFHQPEIAVEAKGLMPCKVDNTALFIVATNNEDGPIRIEHNGTERRYSFISSQMNLLTVIGDKLGVSASDIREMMSDIDKTVWRNKDEVARFLGVCVREAAQLGCMPRALHGSDFNELVDMQKSIVEQLCEEVMLAPNFEYAVKNDLYAMYKEKAKDLNPGASPMSEVNFAKSVKNWLKRNSHIVDKQRQWVKAAGGVKKQVMVYVNTNVVDDNGPEDGWYFADFRPKVKKEAKMSKIVEMNG